MPLVPWQITVEPLLSGFTLISPACQGLRKNSRTVPTHCKQIGNHFILIPHYLRLVWEKKNVNPFKYPINTKHFLEHVNHFCSLMWICLILFAREPLTEPHITSSAISFSAEHWKGRFTGRFYKCWPYRLIAPFPFHSLRDVRSVGLISVVKKRPIYLSGLNMPKDTFICFELILMQHP